MLFGKDIMKGEYPVQYVCFSYVTSSLTESRSLGWERKLGRIFDLKLNTFSSPIVNKYREGKVQSTLKRESNAPEIAAV